MSTDQSAPAEHDERTEGRVVKAYLAARYSRHPEMRGVRDVLGAIGIDVTARWIDCHTDVVGDFTASFTTEALNTRPTDCAPLGRHDLEDIDAADTVISFTYPVDGVKGGRHVEFGYALAKGKRLIVVGPRQHIFHTLAEVDWYPDWAHLLMALATERARDAPDEPSQGDAA
jgi:hypothetical protein